jgi:ubiquinone/menaquinone biosynthesis C-methylase UbiE
MRLITRDDIIDTYVKLKQRGISFISSKFNINAIKRAKTAFNHSNIESSNWWIIPKIKKRWNYMVTGDENNDFVDYTVLNYLQNIHNIKMLSLGSGSCTNELKFASYKNFELITCSDISDIPLDRAKEIAAENKLKNIEFIVQNTNTFKFPESYYDLVYFRASLHHFKNIDDLLSNSIKQSLKKNGFLIIDEYVGPNRLQFPKHQIQAINQALKLIPKKYRKRYKLNFYKNTVSGSGVIRMRIADPSECVESANILPTIHTNYRTIFEADYGGNILMTALKDISHNFIDLTKEKEKVLDKLFVFEDDYLKTHPSDFVFGIYQKL